MMGIRQHLASLLSLPSRREQSRRRAEIDQQRATSPEEELSQRETRRLAGMSTEDQAWERAALQRNRDAQDTLMP
jgi:hypothetical protein